MRNAETRISFEDMKAQEALQMHPQPGIPVEIQMDVSYVKANATHQLVNNQNDLAVFEERARKLMLALLDS